MANEYYDYLKTEGVINPDTSELLSDTQSVFISQFGKDLSLEESTPQGRLIEAITMAKKFVLGECALIANQLNPQYASGVFLDSLGSLFKVVRKGATATTVWVNVVVNKATTIPAGTQITDKNGNVFESINNTVITQAGQYSIQFQCQETGKIEVGAGDINTPSAEMINLGVDSATNQAAGITGYDREGDESFSARIEAERYTGKSLVGDIEAAVDEIPAVICSKVYNNGDSVPKPAIEGGSVDVDANSILAIVFGGEDNAIANALISNISAGCGYTALEGQSITISTGYGKNNSAAYNPVSFNRPKQVNIYAAMTVSNGSYTGADIVGDIKSFLADWSVGANTAISTVAIGEPVSPFSLANMIQQYFGCYVSTIQIGTSQESLGFAEIPIQANQIPYFETQNITVNVI